MHIELIYADFSRLAPGQGASACVKDMSRICAGVFHTLFLCHVC